MKTFMAAVASVAAISCLALAPAQADDYPSKPIRVIAATSAGGTSDLYARSLGEELRKAWGQPVIIENKPGGHFTIGARTCAEATNDGYTICFLPAEALIYNEFLYKKIPYNPVKDFAPITNPFFNTQVLVVSSSLGVKSLADLAKLSKAKPKTLSYVAPSVPLFVFMEKWKKETGADLVSVPFKGGGDAVNGLLSGTTPVAFFGLANMISLIRAGKLEAIAVEADERSPLLPDVPTLRELGYKGDLTRVYFGFVAPAGTPQPVIDKISAEINRINKIPEFRQKRMIDLALEPVADTPAEFAAFLTKDREKSREIVKESGLPKR